MQLYRGLIIMAGASAGAGANVLCAEEPHLVDEVDGYEDPDDPVSHELPDSGAYDADVSGNESEDSDDEGGAADVKTAGAVSGEVRPVRYHTLYRIDKCGR